MDAGDLILISVDDHICEPANMFDAHVPARYKDLAPRVVEDDRGIQQWWYGNIKGRNLGLNAVAGKPREFFHLDASRYDEMRKGCYDVHERVRDMNAGGQLAGLKFPNFTGFSGQVLNQGPDRDVNEIMIQAYNDWHVDEWCGTYPDRFIPCGLLPLFDVERAAREVRRLAAKDCYAVGFSENPAALNMPSIHSGYWDPLMSACSDEGTVLCCHVGSSSRSPQCAPDAPVSVPATLAPIMAIYTFADLLWADFWQRFPQLRIALSEGDVGWMPYFLARAEYTQERCSGWTHHTFAEGDSPTSIFHKHILCCFIDDSLAVEMMHHFNIDNVSWESDFPHSSTVWPHGPELLAKLAESLTAEEIAKVSHENAMRHYQFDPFKYRPREKCTAAALRAESPDVDTVTHVGHPPSHHDLDQYQAVLRSVAGFE